MSIFCKYNNEIYLYKQNLLDRDHNEMVFLHLVPCYENADEITNCLSEGMIFHILHKQMVCHQCEIFYKKYNYKIINTSLYFNMIIVNLYITSCVQ